MDALKMFFESDKQAILDYMAEFYPSSSQNLSGFIGVMSFDDTLKGAYLTYLEYWH